MLLIIGALLLILGQDHCAAVEGQIIPLDMAENSVDDRYVGCREKMADRVKTKLLKNELNKSPDFKTAWGKGEEFAKTPKKDAIQSLKKTQNQCMLTYRRTKVEFNKNVLNKEVRFGSFASSSLRRNITHFGKVSCFEINTCEGADLTKYSKLPHEKEVLIPPYEKFKVTAVKTEDEQGDFKCKTVFTLKSTGIRSDLNCALFKKPSKNKTKYYALDNVL